MSAPKPMGGRRRASTGSVLAQGVATSSPTPTAGTGVTRASKTTAPPRPLPTRRSRRRCRVTVDISSCRYAIIRQCLRARDFRLVKGKPEDGQAVKWDMWWSDRGDRLRELPRLHAFQKVNHFPSMEEICRKDFLAHNLNAIHKLLPEAFAFFPRTFLLPAECVALRDAMQNGPKHATYIAKPRAQCQGKGITLVQSHTKLPAREPCVVQRYIDNPLLLDGFKFDLRIYVLVFSVDPMKLYIFRNGLARFCTTPFQRPTRRNLAKKRMHLTNYAINKNSKDFEQATPTDSGNKGSKRSLATVMKQLEERGLCSSSAVWQQICDIVIKTLLCIEPKLQASYKSFFGSERADEAQWGPKCFEILGFDIMLDAMGKAWLFEVNHAPSFAGDSPLDREVKTALISSTLELLGVSNDKKRQYLRQTRAEWTRRLWASNQKRPVGITTVSGASSHTREERSGEVDDSNAGVSEDDGSGSDSAASVSSSSNQSDSLCNEDNNQQDLSRPIPEPQKCGGASLLTTVLGRRNRVTPIDDSQVPAYIDFTNEYSLLFPVEGTLRGTSLEQVRSAAQVNKSKLWS